jgi:hypothetical protein
VEEYGLTSTESGEEKAPRRLLVGRLLIELPVSVEKRGYGSDVSRGRLLDLNLKSFGVHADKGTWLGRGVNCFVNRRGIHRDSVDSPNQLFL